MLNFKILFCFDINIRPLSGTIEYKGKFFVWYFLDLPLALITSKIQLAILSTSFWSWTEGIFSHTSKIVFMSSEIAEYCWPSLTVYNNQSPQIFYRIEFWRARRVVKKSYFLFKQLHLCYWCIAALSCWKIHSSPHRRCPFCARDKSFSKL